MCYSQRGPRLGENISMLFPNRINWRPKWKGAPISVRTFNLLDQWFYWLDLRLEHGCNVLLKPPHWFFENLSFEHTMFFFQSLIQLCKIFLYINFYLLFDDGNEKLTILTLLFLIHCTFFTYAIKQGY